MHASILEAQVPTLDSVQPHTVTHILYALSPGGRCVCMYVRACVRACCLLFCVYVHMCVRTRIHVCVCVRTWSDHSTYIAADSVAIIVIQPFPPSFSLPLLLLSLGTARALCVAGDLLYGFFSLAWPLLASADCSFSLSSRSLSLFLLAFSLLPLSSSLHRAASCSRDGIDRLQSVQTHHNAPERSSERQTDTSANASRLCSNNKVKKLNISISLPIHTHSRGAACPVGR